MTSDHQLAKVLQKERLIPEDQTTVNEKSLSGIKCSFLDLYMPYKKLAKLHGTYLQGIQREVDPNGILHAFFSLLTAVTFRSNSSNPNFQNIPIRNPKIGRIIRQLFIPRNGRALCEIDISGAEVRIAATYNHDPRLIDYILDPTKDMHRDMASECFKADVDQVSKQMRYAGKNMFVFPEFYGSWFKECAANLWEYSRNRSIQLTDGTPVRDHLKNNGLRTSDRFEEHIKEVERAFWEDRFAVYTEWKDKWWSDYLKRGWFETLTGFVCKGVMKRNDAINYPIQGTAFQCLLWALTKVRKILKRRKMKTLLIGQIHDSLLADVPFEEMDEYVSIVRTTITKSLQVHWPWIVVPLQVDVEASDRNWFEKKSYTEGMFA